MDKSAHSAVQIPLCPSPGELRPQSHFACLNYPRFDPYFALRADSIRPVETILYASARTYVALRLADSAPPPVSLVASAAPALPQNGPKLRASIAQWGPESGNARAPNAATIISA